MTERLSHAQEERAASDLARLLHEGSEEEAPFAVDAELERLLRATRDRDIRQPKWSGRRAGALAATVLAVVMLSVAFVWQNGEGRALTFSADGVPGRQSAPIAAGSARAVTVAFSDGSVFDVQPTTRLRVDSSSSKGARLTLVSGKTVAHVVHRPSSSWSVAAGPFEVQVTGTRFGATWDAKEERLSVELYEGSVLVAGGALTSPVAVRAGQRLEAGRRAGDWVLTALDGPTSARTPAQAASTAPVTPAPSSSPSPAVASTGAANRNTPSTEDWPAMLGRADFDGIVRQANELGVDRCLTSCASRDLRLLADSARYVGRYGLAERTLLALRKRFPADAANAAFLLGRLEESRDPQKALFWYTQSLEEAPNGVYAAEAKAGQKRSMQGPVNPSPSHR